MLPVLPFPGTDEFIEDIWRKRPVLYRSLFSEAELASFSKESFFSWCRNPVVARIYTKSNINGISISRAADISNVEDVPEIFNICNDRNEKFTILLNNVDQVAASVRELELSLNIPFSWRLDDTVATLSIAGSSIGYHSGHEDGFIVQAVGKRRWKIWDAELLPLADRRSIFMRDDSFQPERAQRNPIIDTILNAGDAIYLPTFCPHEGITIENSVSLAFAWKGIAVYEVLASLKDTLSNQDVNIVEANRELFFRVLPDFLDKPTALIRMCEMCHEAFLFLGHGAPSKIEVNNFLSNLIYRKV